METKAKSELKRSEVADSESGKSKLSNVRTSAGMFISKSKNMGMQRYEHGQQYEPHCDYFVDKVNIAWGGHRLGTVLMYLFDVAEGGETVFPLAEPNGIPDINILHGGCPVIEGEKWSATEWIHVDSFTKNLENNGNCTDLNDSCERWAALGECTKNLEYMVATPDLPGYCRRNCRMC